MIRPLLLLILIASAVSCKKKSDPQPDPGPDLTSKLVGTYEYLSVDLPPGVQTDNGLYKRQLKISSVDRTTLKVNDFHSITIYELSYPKTRIDSSSFNVVVKLERDDQFSYENRTIKQGANGTFEKIVKFQVILKEGGLNLHINENSPDPTVSYSANLFLKRK